jgi:hypothetical protein
MARHKQVSKKRKSQLDSDAAAKASPAVVQEKLADGEVTQLLELANPELSGLTAKFTIGSKYYEYVYPGNGSRHLGQAPTDPPLRSPLYRTNPELVGAKYAITLHEMEYHKPGITMRWKKVASTGASPLTCVSRQSRILFSGRLSPG